MSKSKIEWTDRTWNPVTGCTKISPGCQNCYAERMSKRLAGRAGYPEDNPFRVTFHHDRLNEPLKWNKPSRIFICSMGDLFHDSVSDEQIDLVFAVMAMAKQHTFLLLTKRAERMAAYINKHDRLEQIRKMTWVAYPGYTYLNTPVPYWPMPNVWLGVTAENQEQADKRIPILLQTPAEVRFVSVEPMLAQVDLESIPFDRYTKMNVLQGCGITTRPGTMGQSIPNIYSNKLDWVICGGESGPGARPMHPDWARSLRDQCKFAGVPFFLKQMPINGKLVKMPELDGVVWNDYPEVQA